MEVEVGDNETNGKEVKKKENKAMKKMNRKIEGCGKGVTKGKKKEEEFKSRKKKRRQGALRFWPSEQADAAATECATEAKAD